VYPNVVGRAGLSQPAARWMQNIMLRRRAGTDAPYLHHRQHRDEPAKVGDRGFSLPFVEIGSRVVALTPNRFCYDLHAS